MNNSPFKYYVFYDLETTGMNPAFDQILQFAAVKTDLNFNQIEEYLVAFSGYDTHKIIQRMSQNTVVWYETKSDDARLKRNLRKMLDFIGVEGQVNCVKNTCTITKI